MSRVLRFAIVLVVGACGGGGEPVHESGAAGSGDGGHGGPSRGQYAALIEAGGTCATASDCKSGFCFDPRGVSGNLRLWPEYYC